MSSEQSARRKFLKQGVAIAGLAAGGIVPASTATPSLESVDQLHAYGQRSRFENWTRKGKHLWPPGGKNRLTTPGSAYGK